MKQLLVPVDFTTSSRNASEYAIQLSQALAADVCLLHVYAEPLPAGNVPDTTIVTADLQTENRARIRQEIALLKNKFGVVVSGDAIPGFKSDTINEAAAEMNSDLIVMGVKSDRKTSIFGRTTLRMIRKSNKPLLLIPEGAVFRPLKHTVLAVDFSEMISNADMHGFYALVKKFDSSVSVLHVMKTGDEEMESAREAEKLQMGRALSTISFVYEPIAANDTNEGILNFIDSHPVDLVVMIAHHHSLWERLFSSGHTGTISSKINVPLLVLKVQQPFQ